ncbi:MAG: hypothetical protein RL299_480 [Pseudomonadota bacterium]|jgi:hypothetical protein
MIKHAKSLAGTLALAALTLPSMAQAATAQCMTKPELRGMVAYMLPFVVDSAIEKCSASVSSDSFMATRAPELSKELTKGQPAAWPMAKRAFMKFSGDSSTESAAMMDSMPESAMRPLLESVLTQEFTSKIKTKDCKDIDTVLGTLAPLPASNFVDLITEVVVIGAREDKEMRVCEA